MTQQLSAPLPHPPAFLSASFPPVASSSASLPPHHLYHSTSNRTCLFKPLILKYIRTTSSGKPALCFFILLCVFTGSSLPRMPITPISSGQMSFHPFPNMSLDLRPFIPLQPSQSFLYLCSPQLLLLSFIKNTPLRIETIFDLFFVHNF